MRKLGILTAKELQITEQYTVSQLLEALKSGQLTALEVTVAYCKRAAIAQQLVCDFVLGCLFCIEKIHEDSFCLIVVHSKLI